MRSSQEAPEKRHTSDASTIRAMPVLALFSITGALLLTDIVLDWQSARDLGHLVVEGLLTVVTLGASGWIGAGLFRERQATRAALLEARAAAEAAQSKAAAAAEEAQRWRQEAQSVLAGLGEAIDRQFQRWSLTPAEAEVALLLLKGLSTKEIAAVRDTSDATVRQQARSVYGKAGLGGRAELSAFFLEDLLLPQAPPSSP